MISISKRIADELSARENQVEAAIALLDEGSTVPFIARYRKEATGGLDDTQLRNLEERLRYLRELEERRTAILSSVAEQGQTGAGIDCPCQATLEARPCAAPQELPEIAQALFPGAELRAVQATGASLRYRAMNGTVDPSSSGFAPTWFSRAESSSAIRLLMLIMS